MSVEVGLEKTYQNNHNGGIQSYSRPVKALMLYSQRRNSMMENESFNRKLKLPSSNWSNDAPQNIELKLTVSISSKYVLFNVVSYYVHKKTTLWYTMV